MDIRNLKRSKIEKFSSSVNNSPVNKLNSNSKLDPSTASHLTKLHKMPQHNNNHQQKQNLSPKKQNMHELMKKNKTILPNNTQHHAPKSPLELQQKAHDLLAFRKKLPIFEVQQQIISYVKSHNVLVIIGETGSGKTTQIPQFIHQIASLGIKDAASCIGVTQPRRVAAISVAARVADEMGVALGSLVGYSVRFEEMSSPQTAIKYMTDGMLLRELMLDPILSRYRVLILDEAHERTLNTDILLGFLKQIQQKRPDLKIIVMSATLEAELFENFFGAKVLYIEGRQFPVDIMYTFAPQEDIIDAVFTTVLQIHINSPPGDILVFLPGKDHIETLEKILSEKSRKFPDHLDPLAVLPIHASLPSEDQLKVFDPAPAKHRKVVLATNIAETSITISGIKYVVDPGLSKSRGYHLQSGIDSLTVAPISKASARQRSGRAGRESSGICYRLYTEQDFTHLEDSTVPEIKRTNLSNALLQLKALHVKNPLQFPWIESPPLENVKRSMLLLAQLGAFDKTGELSELGKQMATIPLQPLYSKVLLESKKFGCTEEILDIVSMLSVETESFFFVPKDKEKQVANMRAKFLSNEGDHFFLLNLFSGFRNSKFSRRWCHENFLHQRHMFFAQHIRAQLVGYCKKLDIPLVSCEQDPDPIRNCFMNSFFMNVALLTSDASSYITENDKKKCQIHPTSVLFHRRVPYVLFNELVFTKKYYMRDVMEVDGVQLKKIQRALFGNNNNNSK